MGVITKLAIRNMKRRKARYILTTVTLVIGVALFGGILIVNDSFQVTFVNDIDRRMGTADILLRSTENEDGWFDPDDLEDIEDLAHITDISYRISGFSVFITAIEGGSRDENSTLTAVYGIDPDSSDEADLGGPPSILDSEVDGNSIEELLEDADDDEVVITESLKIQLDKDFEAGDDIYILPIDHEKSEEFSESEQDLVFSDSRMWPKFKVLAIIRDMGEARDFDTDTPEEFTSPSRGPCIFTSLDTAHDLVDGENDHNDEVTLAAIGVDDLNLVEEIIDDIEDELDNDWVAADLKTDSVEDINNSMESNRTSLLTFATIALILSIILILNIFNIIKEEQEYETGMLRAIGASKAETFRMFLTQGIIMGIVGAIIGTICSYFMSYFIFWIVLESLRNLPGEVGEYYDGFEFNIILLPETIIQTLAVGIISCILASIYPSWKASRKPIIQCLNPLAQKSEREKKNLKKKITVGIFALMLILYGTYLIISVFSVHRQQRTVEHARIAIIAPTMILFGIIVIMNLFVSPFTRIFVKMFSPYLKHTKLLTKKNVLRHRKRTILTFSMISLTTSSLIGYSVLLYSIEAGIETTVNDVMGCDVRIISLGSSLEFAENLEDQRGVDEAMGITYRNVQIWDEDEWVGHSALEEQWDLSIYAHVIDPIIMRKRMARTEVVDPIDRRFEDLMSDLKKRYTVMIPLEVAEEFDLEEGDFIRVKFSLGIDYPSLNDMRYRVEDNAKEISIETELKVIGIVDKIQGFGFSNLIGEDVENFRIFISWNTWEALSLNNLPAGGTDIIFRQMTNSGVFSIDNVQSKWFNVSDVIEEIENVSEIEYYTTRMDSYSPSYPAEVPFNVSNPAINFESSVVGLRTNSYGKFKDDSYFGSHTLLNHTDSTMEELLNTTEMVCIVDQSYVNMMREFDPNFDVGSNITIFPQLFQKQDTIYTISLWSNATATNGTITDGDINSLTVPIIDFDTMEITSNKRSLEFFIDFNMTYHMTYFINPNNITIKSFVNETIEELKLEVLNYYTGTYEKLGDINSTDDEFREFSFNDDMPVFSYINQSNFIMRLRISGYNSTYDSDYTLDIDYLDILVDNSTYPLIAPSYWSRYQVIDIIEDPTLYNTERALWSAEVESYYDVEPATNTVYINYEHARNYVYPMHRGSLANGTYDEITSVLIHCINIETIETAYKSLKQELNEVEIPDSGGWTAIDLKTPTLETRRFVIDWFIWIEDGYDDEEVLECLIEYIQDHGYLVLFGFTKTYVEDMFRGSINLITMTISGILTFAIIIAMVGLALHSLLSTMARRREIGMLRSIGLNKKGVIRTISGETIIISLLGVFFGILAGLLQGYLMVSAYPETGIIKVMYTVPWFTIGILIVVTMITAIISSRYPSRWAANINIIDAVRTR